MLPFKTTQHHSLSESDKAITPLLMAILASLSFFLFSQLAFAAPPDPNADDDGDGFGFDA